MCSDYSLHLLFSGWLANRQQAVVLSPAGSHLLAAFLRGWYWSWQYCFNTFNNDLDDEMHYTVSQSTATAKWKGAAGTMESRAALGGHLTVETGWQKSHEVQQRQRQSPAPGMEQLPCNSTSQGTTGWKAALQQLRVPADSKLNTSQRHAHTGLYYTTVANSLSDMIIFPLFCTCVTTSGIPCPV